MEGQYSEKVMEHFRNPRNVGEIPDASGIGNVGNPVCVPPKTLISCNSSIDAIEDIEAHKKVLSHDGKYHRILRIFKRAYKNPLINIKVHNLGAISATPEHHILAMKTSHFTHKFYQSKKCIQDWYMARELRKGDMILYPIPQEEMDLKTLPMDEPKPKHDFKSKPLSENIAITGDFLRLVGYYLAEGYVRTDKCKGTLGFVFGAKEEFFVGDVVAIMKSAFGLELNNRRDVKNSINIEFYSARLARFFERLFGKGAAGKKLPHDFILLPIEKQRSLLCGLWRGDGYINNKGAKYVTISKQLSHQVRLLLLRQRVIFSFLTISEKGMHKENYCIYIKEESSLKKLAAIMGVTIERPPKLKNIHKCWFDENYFYTPVKGITHSIYKGMIYNLEVEGAHSYVSDAATLHNCGDIMRLYIKVDENDVITDAKFKTFGCLPPDMEVVLSSGGWGAIRDIAKETNVVNGDGEETQVAETYVREYSGLMFDIMPFVSPYNRFSVTSEHPVLAVKRSSLKRTRRSSPKCDWLQIDKEELLSTKPDYIRAGSLEKSDYLVFNVNRTVKDDPSFTREIMRLLGYYLSEGYIIAKGRAVAFAFNKSEKKTMEELKSLLKMYTGKEPRERVRGNVCEIWCSSTKLASFLKTQAGSLARKKALSRNVMLLPYEKQKEMLKTYLVGDGDFYRRRPGESFTYRIVTASPYLAIQSQEILARGGIFASIKETLKRGGCINGRKIKESLMYVITFKLEREHEFVHRAKDHFLVPVKSIKTRTYNGPVYNFQVAGEPNSYLVKGFAVHNCGAAISTSSMVTELVKGKTVKEALKISNHAVAEALGGLPKIKMHCSVLAEEALRAAIDDYMVKKKKIAS